MRAAKSRISASTRAVALGIAEIGQGERSSRVARTGAARRAAALGMGLGDRRRGSAARSAGEKWQISKIVSTCRAGIGTA